jgi:hypothetical protein
MYLVLAISHFSYAHRVTTPFRLWEWLAGWLSAGVRLAAQRACVVSKRTSARRKTIAKSKTATAAARQQHCRDAPAGRFAPTPALATLTQLKPLSPDEAPSTWRRAPPCCVSRLRPILRRLRRHRNLARSKKGAPGSQALQHSADNAGRREAVRLGISDSASAGGGGYGGGDGDGAGGTPLEVEDKGTPSIWRQNASLGCSARRSQCLH